jgi:hypothetical protein
VTEGTSPQESAPKSFCLANKFQTTTQHEEDKPTNPKLGTATLAPAKNKCEGDTTGQPKYGEVQPTTFVP